MAEMLSSMLPSIQSQHSHHRHHHHPLGLQPVDMTTCVNHVNTAVQQQQQQRLVDHRVNNLHHRSVFHDIFGGVIDIINVFSVFYSCNVFYDFKLF